MSALHVKTFQVKVSESVLFADLQVISEGDIFLRVRITKTKYRGEKFIGFARLNRAGELVKADEELNLTEAQRTAIEKAIKEALI